MAQAGEFSELYSLCYELPVLSEREVTRLTEENMH